MAGPWPRCTVLHCSHQNSIVIAEADGSIRYVNETMMAEFGWTADELEGKNVRCLMGEPFASKHDEFLQRSRAPSAEPGRCLRWRRGLRKGRKSCCFSGKFGDRHGRLITNRRRLVAMLTIILKLLKKTVFWPFFSFNKQCCWTDTSC